MPRVPATPPAPGHLRVRPTRPRPYWVRLVAEPWWLSSDPPALPLELQGGLGLRRDAVTAEH